MIHIVNIKSKITKELVDETFQYVRDSIISDRLFQWCNGA